MLYFYDVFVFTIVMVCLFGSASLYIVYFLKIFISLYYRWFGRGPMSL